MWPCSVFGSESDRHAAGDGPRPVAAAAGVRGVLEVEGRRGGGHHYGAQQVSAGLMPVVWALMLDSGDGGVD